MHRMPKLKIVHGRYIWSMSVNIDKRLHDYMLYKYEYTSQPSTTAPVSTDLLYHESAKKQHPRPILLTYVFNSMKKAGFFSPLFDLQP